MRHELLTIAEMRRADQLAIAAGIPGTALMERAGAALAAEASKSSPSARSVLVLAGPGNNGGDGFVAARHLMASGFDVTVALLGRREALTGDAAWAAGRYRGRLIPIEAAGDEAPQLILDCVFGAGLSRPVEGALAALFHAIAQRGVMVVAADVPSGVEGDSGAVLGAAIPAALTVTFARLKPAHLLMPGRALCGRVICADIGIPDAIITGLGVLAFANRPELWRHALPRPSTDGHKYQRGHVLALSGPVLQTGAARLSARAALRMGAGLVTLAGERPALLIHAAHLTAVMLREIKNAADLGALLADPRFNVVIAGPGNGVDASTKAKVIETLERKRAMVLDADALTVFSGEARGLARMIAAGGAPVVATPHEGEFQRLFAGEALLALPSKIERARAAAALLQAVVVLKGADTVVAHPDGRVSVADNAPAFLATAGAGDVLAGMIAGLLAQGMPAFEAASAAVWLHGAAASDFGMGLTADDLPDALPGVLRGLLAD